MQLMNNVHMSNIAGAEDRKPVRIGIGWRTDLARHLPPVPIILSSVMSEDALATEDKATGDGSDLIEPVCLQLTNTNKE